MSGRNFLIVCLFFLAFAGCRAFHTPSPGWVEASPASSPQATDAQPLPTATASSPSATLRQAVAYCTDRSALIRSVYPWLANTEPFEAYSFLPRFHWAFSGGGEDVVRYPFSPETGISLLEGIGWKLADASPYRANAKGETLQLTLTTTEVKFRQTWTAVWEEQMKTCGIQIARKFVPADWLFGAETGLSRRDFELAAFASASLDVRSPVKAFLCDQIPDAGNGWRGQNFSGWCNPIVQEAARRLLGTLDLAEQQAAFRTIQSQFHLDLPVLPLFYRADVFAIHPGLENFIPPDDGIHTWNAADWRIAGKDTIVIGSDGEPAGLDEPAYIAQVIGTLISGRDAVQVDGKLQPVFLSRIPTRENGQVAVETVTVKEGDRVVDADGNPAQLTPGIMVRSAQGEVSQYSGGEITLRQLSVDFEFQPGLTWSDGAPVSQADYELGYRGYCAAEAGSSANAACNFIVNVEFLSDTRYQVHWLPGFEGSPAAPYLLPPIRRAPAHQLLADGRKLAEVPALEWAYLDEITRAPIGIGPYVLKGWINGESMVLEANPYYFGGSPATPRIIVRFLEHRQAFAALLDGEVDILDAETIGPPDIDDFRLIKAQDEGKIRLVLRPSSIWEQITFKLVD